MIYDCKIVVTGIKSLGRLSYLKTCQLVLREDLGKTVYICLPRILSGMGTRNVGFWFVLERIVSVGRICQWFLREDSGEDWLRLSSRPTLGDCCRNDVS